MGKISDALDKAGYQGGLQRNDSSGSQQDEIVEKTSEVLVQPGINQNEADSESSNSDENTKHVDVRAIGSATSRWDERLFKSVNENKDLPEIFSTLRSRILHPIDGRPVPKTIMVTSAVPNEGKTFITSNIGISFAHGMDQHALIVDCDLRKPTLASLLGVVQESGLVDYLRNYKTLPQIIVKTAVNKLSIVPSGKPPINPSELLSSARMIDLVEELADRYEDRTILFDSPPMLAAAEAQVLAKQVDGVVLVVRQGKSRKDQIQRVIDTISAEKIIGLVFNDYQVNYIERSYVGNYSYYRS